MTSAKNLRAWALVGTALATSLSLATGAQAQEEAGATTRLEEIVVTAQKREQSLQDVPMSVSVLSQEAIAAAKISRVSDISAMVPGVLVRSISGGSTAAGFLIRGSNGASISPGSDATIAFAIDGIFIVASSGNDFDIPNIERIEVLKGPQGTLYGRNATGGVISITTADPKDEFDLVQKFTVGNYDQFVSKTTVNTGAFGPFSAMLSYVRNTRDGDVKNLGAGTRWNYAMSGQGTLVSPKRLGDRDIHSVFAGLKFEPTDIFRAVYKFDWSKNTGSPNAAGMMGISPATVASLGPAYGIPAAQFQNFNYRRPDAVNNAYHTDLYAKAYGHVLTATWDISDNVTVKNIAGYRKHYQSGNYQLDGLGGLVTGTPNFVGQPAGTPVLIFGTNTYTTTEQWSDEVQINATTKLADITAGFLYFHSKAAKGSKEGTRLANVNGIALPGTSLLPGFVVPASTGTTTYTEATALAAYAQADIHITDQLDLQAGLRLTQDKKKGRLRTINAAGTSDRQYDDYKKTLPSYQVGLNYKPNDDTLVYGKFAHSFVSGGAIGPLVFKPEKADSWEAGVKADFFDDRVRTNVALYTVKYNSVQGASSGQLFCTDGTFAPPAATCPRIPLGTVITEQGDARAKGVEADATFVVAEGLTIGGNISYLDFKYTELSLISQQSGLTAGTRAKWGAAVNARYETQPLFGDARLVLAADANYHSSYWYSPLASFRVFAPHAKSPSAWVANARAELTDIGVAGHSVTVGAWVRNLADNKAPQFGGIAGVVAFAEFQAARTYGLDLTFDF
jgi:iron complex outermembrane receptor protein